MKMEKKMENLLKTDGISCMGFGIVGKAVMMDSVLTPEAKAIYSSSLTGPESVPEPSQL